VKWADAVIFFRPGAADFLLKINASARRTGDSAYAS
jgi:hypothetical protein